MAFLLLVLLALKLRGSRGGDDMMRPRRRPPKRISPRASRLIELVSAGDEEGALNMIREAGYEEAEARKVLALAVKVEDYEKTGPAVW